MLDTGGATLMSKVFSCALHTAILACIHVNGPGGRLIQPRITIHVTFARFSQCCKDGLLRITLTFASIEWPGRKLSGDTSFVFVGLGVAEIDPSDASKARGALGIAWVALCRQLEAHSCRLQQLF